MVLIGFAVVGAFSVALWAIARFENPSSHFESYESLRASGLIERGWVPAHLPRSATEIEESHDLDTNQGQASFKYSAGDTVEADKGCQALHKTNEGRKYLCPPYDGQTAKLVLRADGTGIVSVYADEI